MVCPYLWQRFLLSLCYLGATRQLCNIQPSHPSLLESCAALLWLCYTMSSCGVVGDICSSPPAKSPHHMVLFTCSLFHIPAMWKKALKHTNSIQMTTEEIQLQETHSPPTLPWAHSGLCCMRTRMRGWVCCWLRPIKDSSRALKPS